MEDLKFEYGVPNLIFSERVFLSKILDGLFICEYKPEYVYVMQTLRGERYLIIIADYKNDKQDEFRFRIDNHFSSLEKDVRYYLKEKK